MDLKSLSFDAICPLRAAIMGGREIMRVYRALHVEVQVKDDCTPVTMADTRSHAAIASELLSTGFPVLSEEGTVVGFDERRNWERFWSVDPLDGTKEFIKRNGQFAINIAFVEGLEPVWGLIFIPVEGLLYHGGPGLGLFEAVLPKNWEKESFEKLIGYSFGKQYSCLPNTDAFTIVGSRSHHSPRADAVVDAAMRIFPSVASVKAGSAIKQVWVATGRAHFYPRYGTTMEWDTAAGHALVRAVGGDIVDMDGFCPIKYNKADLRNPNFYCHRGDEASQKLLKDLCTSKRS